MNVAIRSIGTANPPLYVSQREAHAFFTANFELTPEEEKLYSDILLDGPIRGRYIGVEEYSQAFDPAAGDLTSRFATFAPRTAAGAARDALAQAEMEPDEIDAVIVNTCTGYLCPGLSSYVVEQLGLSADTKIFDLMGMGCGGAVPNLEVGCGLIASGQARQVLCVAVEICSATGYMDPDPGIVVSNCIFGDGAAAVILSDRPHTAPCTRLTNFASVVLPEHREALRYRTAADGRLRNVLTRRVPVLGADVVARLVDRLLTRNGLGLSDIRWWAVHAGGTAVLDRVGERLGLRGSQLDSARRIFAEYGNMSSPTSLFVLRDILARDDVTVGDRGLILGFGAGFSGFGALFAIDSCETSPI